MTNREIYEAALVKLDEPLEAGMNPDYDERAPQIIAQFCRLASDVEGKYRAAYGMTKRVGKIKSCPDLDEEFVLCDAFAAAAVSYLASDLVRGDDERFSDTLSAEWTDFMATVESTLPMAVERIVDRYAF